MTHIFKQSFSVILFKTPNIFRSHFILKEDKLSTKVILTQDLCFTCTQARLKARKCAMHVYTYIKAVNHISYIRPEEKKKKVFRKKQCRAFAESCRQPLNL